MREVCWVIQGINDRLRRTPDFDKARWLVIERDRLRKQLAVLLDLTPADPDLAGDLQRHQAWHEAKKTGTKPAVYKRHLHSFKLMIWGVWYSAVGFARAGASRA